MNADISQQTFLEERVKLLEEQLETIGRRNLRVEADKAWETSFSRFFAIALITYFTMNLLLWTIGGPFPPIHALVPTTGYVLSTLGLPRLKQWWVKKRLNAIQ